MSRASVIAVVLLLLDMEQLAEGIPCYVGSEARMWSQRKQKWPMKECSACGMFERYSGSDQVSSFTEIFYDCAPKELLDVNGRCVHHSKEEPIEKVLQELITFSELQRLAPDTNWEKAWAVAKGPLGRIRCCGEQHKKVNPKNCMPVPVVLQQALVAHTVTVACRIYENIKRDLTIWRTGMRACAHWVYIRDNRMEQSFWLHEQLKKDDCDENRPCTQVPVDATHAARSMGPMVMCCCVPHENDDTGVLTCTPGNPLTKFVCEKEGVSKLVPFQLGVSLCYATDQFNTGHFGGKRDEL